MGLHVVYYGAAGASRLVQNNEQSSTVVQELGTFDPGEQFGAATLLEGNRAGHTRSVTVKATMSTKCLLFDIHALGTASDTVTTLVSRELNNRRWQFEHFGKVDFDNLLPVKVLGEGSSGRVFECPHLPNKRVYATKLVHATIERPPPSPTPLASRPPPQHAHGC